VERYLADARKLEGQIAAYAARRVAVVSTGSELLAGEIEDTNFAAIRESMEEAGFEVEFGGIAGDSEPEIAGLVARLSGEGFGIIITTGGVGAENKDHTVEALERLDPQLVTAVLAQYKRGHGRHVKDTVRIAIARLGWSTIFALPGPTHEVKLALPVITAGLGAGTALPQLVEAIAAPLRATLPHHHPHRH
jgi:molybdenum cofactor synthesis domain-containing protein